MIFPDISHPVQALQLVSQGVEAEKSRAFHGRLAREPRARGIFITTSSFTRGSQKEAALTGINLIDGNELESLIYGTARLVPL